MRITDYLRDDRMILDLKAHNKKETIKKVSAPLKKAEEIIDFDLFLKDIFAREELKTTGIGKWVAIPHARTDAVKDFVMVFARATEGVEFDSLDGKPVKLVFLIGTPKKEKLNNHLKILARLTRLSQKKHFRDSLLNAKNKIEILNAIREIED